MSSFTELVVSPLSDGKMWELRSEFDYHIGSLQSGDIVRVPAGFKTDFGSVPQALWWLVSPIGKATPAFVLHDFMYQDQERSRLVCDATLLEALSVCGVNGFQRWLIYRGVRLGGWVAWKQHKKEKEKNETKKSNS